MTEEPESVIDIDLDHLEQEWLEHSAKVYKAQIRLAKAQKKHAEADANLDLVKAKADLKVRKLPRKYGLKNVTEGAIKNTVASLQEVQDAIQLVIDAKYMVDNLKALTNALEHRKKALENEVTLWSQGYFSTPRIRVDTSDNVKRKIKTASTKKLHDLGRKKKGDKRIPF